MDQNMSSAPNQSNSAAVVSLVCGIVSIVFAWLGWFSIVSIITGIIAIVFYTKAVKFSSVGKGMATAGLVCGIVGLTFGTLFALCAITCTSWAGQFGRFRLR